MMLTPAVARLTDVTGRMVDNNSKKRRLAEDGREQRRLERTSACQAVCVQGR
jgi:hypothetical protein